MPIVKGRKAALAVMEDVAAHRAALPIFCTASHWNTEAILLAATKICDRYGMESVPVSVAMTFNYRYMAQSRRVTHTNSAKLGFLSCMKHLQVLCDTPDSPYSRIKVLPHLDHADVEVDSWALTEGSEYLASAMFDAQRYPPEENVRITADYVRSFGDRLMIEGIMEELPVEGMHEVAHGSGDDYPERAKAYVGKTGVDFLVADLGTEQQSAASSARYMQDRARAVTGALGGKPMLVLHGTSSLSDADFAGLPSDGVIRVNMWTKIARESGQHAASELFRRAPELYKNDFESAESHRYLMDSIEKAAEMMMEVMERLNYRAFAEK